MSEAGPKPEIPFVCADTVPKLHRDGDSLSSAEKEAMMKSEVDCAGCAQPCASSVEALPQHFTSKIEMDTPLYGSGSAHAWHVVLCSGRS